MGIINYESQEDLDNAFEEAMESEQEKARLRSEIVEMETAVEHRYDEWVSAKEELEELRNQLDEMSDDA